MIHACPGLLQLDYPRTTRLLHGDSRWWFQVLAVNRLHLLGGFTTDTAIAMTNTRLGHLLPKTRRVFMASPVVTTIRRAMCPGRPCIPILGPQSSPR